MMFSFSYAKQGHQDELMCEFNFICPAHDSLGFLHLCINEGIGNDLPLFGEFLLTLASTVTLNDFVTLLWNSCIRPLIFPPDLTISFSPWPIFVISPNVKNSFYHLILIISSVLIPYSDTYSLICIKISTFCCSVYAFL